ncbi:MAG: hypothetical protein ACI9AX_001227, partial [Polaromonas sp.]
RVANQLALACFLEVLSRAYRHALSGSGHCHPVRRSARNRNTASSRQIRFDMIYDANEIEHRLTKPNHQ